MKSGTNRAVLVTELLTHDGPFVVIADDFVAARCSRCGGEAGDDAYFLEAGFLCGPCVRLVVH
jgi:hypothetical protein